MRRLKISLIVIQLALLLIITLSWIGTSPMMNTQQPLEYKPNQTFVLVVDEFKWEGKLQPGRYTNNGVLIIKQ
jgi:hypothetical protein